MSSRRPSRKLSRQVAERAQWRCEYCLSPAAYSAQPFEADHIVPFSLGGKTTLENLAWSCGCNRFKADRTHAYDPRTQRWVPLYNPRLHRWSEHFTWSADVERIIGRTATGRATAITLRMNRQELCNLRRVLYRSGEHPAQSKS